MLTLYTGRQMWKMEAVKCQDVRRSLPPLVEGKLALTEWAIIQAHLLDCAECRKEVDRQRTLAAGRAHANHRRTTVATLGAMAVVLAVAAGGGFFIYPGSWPEIPSWNTPAPPRTTTPIPPAIEAANPVAPAPAARPSPPSARAKGTADATPSGTAPPVPEPAARTTRPAATAEAPTEDRMPTQARPVPALNAPPGAEAMPTQGPARSPGRP
jgi:Putative zinc-finger